MNSNTNIHCNSRNKDFGPQPLVVNIDGLAKSNSNFRTVIWTGEYLQVTLMSIPVGGEIGLEIHNDLDQFIRIEDGNALVKMGKCEDNLDCQQKINSNFAILIPTGTWHNIVNIGRTPLKLYSIYAPPKHPFGTIHKTKQDAERSENAKH